MKGRCRCSTCLRRHQGDNFGFDFQLGGYYGLQHTAYRADQTFLIFRVMFRPELVNLDKYSSALAEAKRGSAILQSLIDGLVTREVPACKRADGMVILSWALIQGLSGLLLEGPLPRMAADDLKSNDEIDSALRTFEFLILRRGKRRL